MKKIYLLLFAALVFVNQNTNAQCSINATASPLNVVCGDPVDLIVINGFGQGAMVFEENFNSGAPTGWQSTSQATYTNPCSPGVDGTTHLWMGSAASVPRIMTTVGFDLSSAIAGATVCFDLLFARQGDAAPCEGPDEPNEGVFLQYSTNNGATWIDVHYFNPNGGNDPQLVNWNNWCFSLPPDAISSNTQIRWAQTSDSGADYDHWGIDNVQIFFNDPDYTITWAHDGYTYPYASTGGTNPTPAYPLTTTTYTVEMTNGTFTCSSSVTVEVVQPTAAVSVERDTAICAGECVTLNADARIIKRPAKTPTYSNNNLTPIANAFGSTTTSTISINDLNMDDVLPGSITSVCISSLNFFGAGLIQIFPPVFGQQTIGDLILRLYCPDGTSIILVPDGQTTSANPLEGYSNTCFIPVGGGNIASATPSYSGNFAPNQPFDNLAGCTANGDWVFEIQSNTAFGFGSGFFGGWNITFDDPEISYIGDFVWSPTTNMTGENTLTPTVCPTSEQVYTISVVDSAGCLAPTLADVTISIDPACCPITFDAAITQPSCGSTDGSVTVTVLNGSGNYTYTWDVGGNSNSLSNIGTGSYTLTVYDITLDCQRDTTIILTASNAPAINNISTTDETCLGAGDGSAQVTASGGTGTLTYSWSNGENTAQIQNLAPGNYTITVSDDLGCETIETIEIFDGPSCCDFDLDLTTTSESCFGLDNGSAEINISGGVAPFTIEWNGVAGSNTLENLAPGNYTVSVTDADNCTETQTFAIQEGPLVEVSAGNDTSIFVGTPLQLNADVSNSTSGSFTWTPSADLSCNDCQNPVSTPLQNVVYTVVYNDDLGCSATDDISVTVISDQPSCIFPDAFTPNNDNINDVFNGLCQGMSFIEMRVYNRWGELVFQESGNLQINGWNGIYKGLEALGEVYVFYVYIEYENGDSESVMGNVTLIR
jgi:gliding motility-associated-like protein